MKSINNQYNTATGAKHEKEINSLGYDFKPEEKIKIRQILDSRDQNFKRNTAEYSGINKTIKVQQEEKKLREKLSPKLSLEDGPKPPHYLVKPSQKSALLSQAYHNVETAFKEEQMTINQKAKKEIYPFIQKAKVENRQTKSPPHSPNHNNDHNH